VIPETFSSAKREQLRLERLGHTSTDRISKVKSSLMVAFESSDVLKPTYNPENGKKNWRLVYCAVHIFVVTLADGYAMQATLIYLSTQYMYTPPKSVLVPL